MLQLPKFLTVLCLLVLKLASLRVACHFLRLPIINSESDIHAYRNEDTARTALLRITPKSVDSLFVSVAAAKGYALTGDHPRFGDSNFKREVDALREKVADSLYSHFCAPNAMPSTDRYILALAFHLAREMQNNGFTDTKGYVKAMRENRVIGGPATAMELERFVKLPLDFYVITPFEGSLDQPTHGGLWSRVKKTSRHVWRPLFQRYLLKQDACHLFLSRQEYFTHRIRLSFDHDVNDSSREGGIDEERFPPVPRIAIAYGSDTINDYSNNPAKHWRKSRRYRYFPVFR